jgi:TRAP-type C4-dicarboxylate transport system substrate-binding protein
MKVKILSLLVAALLLTSATALPQSGITTLKVATLAPKDSLWYQILQDMGEKWNKASGGKIRFVFYAGGTLGDEANMIRQMRLAKDEGGIKVAAVTTIGLESIAHECAALSIPLLFKSNEELDYVLGKIQGRLEKVLEAKDFVVLNWGDAGWVRIFTKKPALTIGDLKKMPIFTSQGNPDTAEIYRNAGFNPQQTAPTDVLTSLTTGRIQAMPTPPLLALANQWFALAPNMIDIKFGVLVGATIIRKDTWLQFDPKLRETLLKEARTAGDRLRNDIRKMDDQAIERMKAFQKTPLNIVKLTPQAEKEWQETAEKFYSQIRGRIVGAEDFDEVMALVKEYRAKGGK